MTEPLPCPFCGASTVSVQSTDCPGTVAVVCFLCEAEGPARKLSTTAIKVWNRRSVTMSDVEQMAERLSDDHFVRLVAGLCHMRCRECGTMTPDGKTCFCNRDE